MAATDSPQIALPWGVSEPAGPGAADNPGAANNPLAANTPYAADNPHDPVVQFVRHQRARRYVIRVTDAGVVRVTIPRWGSKREARAFADREQPWIQKQWRLYLERRTRRAAFEDSRSADGHRVREAELRERAKRELPSRLVALAATHGLAERVTRISIRNQKWRWGSCSPSGHICLNWRLITMPQHVCDYVLIHELMHLKRMDHSAKFWKLVAQACPDYQRARATLRGYARP